jgi:thioredoxin reductase
MPDNSRSATLLFVNAILLQINIYLSGMNHYDVIIIGGSYAGLSAAMSLGRSRRNVLIIDNGRPCNKQTPHSHNFITQDGMPPAEIAGIAKAQVAQYPTVQFYNGTAIAGGKTDKGFEIQTFSGDAFTAKKLIFATGLKDLMPEIEGFAECWGITAIHCPYCHGYEFKDQPTAIFANGDMAYHLAKLVSNLTGQLTLLTNGEPTFTAEQKEKIEKHHINIITAKLTRVQHTNGEISQLFFSDNSSLSVKAMYAALPFQQQSSMPKEMGVEMTDNHLIKIDPMQKTNIPGVYACGDNSGMRSVSNAVAAGGRAGAMINAELCEEAF